MVHCALRELLTLNVIYIVFLFISCFFWWFLLIFIIYFFDIIIASFLISCLLHSVPNFLAFKCFLFLGLLPVNSLYFSPFFVLSYPIFHWISFPSSVFSFPRKFSLLFLLFLFFSPARFSSFGYLFRSSISSLPHCFHSSVFFFFSIRDFRVDFRASSIAFQKRTKRKEEATGRGRGGEDRTEE